MQGIDVDVDVVNNISDALPCWWQEGVFGCVWVCFHQVPPNASEKIFHHWFVA